MKIKVTMEADVSDLPAFREDGNINVYGLFRELYNFVLQSIIDQHTKKKETDPAIHAAILKNLEQDKKLTQRLLDTIKVEHTS